MTKGSFRKLIKDVRFHRPKVRIGELLVQRGIITPQQPQEALNVQQGEGRDKLLGQILCELGFIAKEELCLILAVQGGFPYIEIGRCAIDKEVLALLPMEFIQKYRVMPLDVFEDILTVSMVDPLDQSTIEELEKFTRRNAKVFLTTRQEFEETFERYFAKT